VLHSENERQRSVHNVQSFKSGNWKVYFSLLCISVVLAAYKFQADNDTLHALSWKWMSTECQQLLALHDGQSKGKMAANVYIWSFERFHSLKCSGSLSCSIENEWSCNCLGGCQRTISCLSAYKGCQNLVYRCLWSFTTKITQDTWPTIIVALLMLIVNWGRESVVFPIAYEGGQ